MFHNNGICGGGALVLVDDTGRYSDDSAPGLMVWVVLGLVVASVAEQRRLVRLFVIG